MSDKKEVKVKMVKAYTPSGKEVEVNEYAASCIAAGDKTTKGWSLEKPKAK